MTVFIQNRSLELH